MYILALRDAPL